MAPGKHSADSKDYYESDYNYTQNDYEPNFRRQENYDNYDDYDDDCEDGFGKRKAIILGVIIGLLIVVVAIIGIRSNKNDTETNTVGTTNGLVETYNGYNVLGKIVIDEFGVEQYILDSTEDKALENGVIKLHGGSLNNYGNFCIAGHNKPGVFEKIAEMESGDLFTVIEPDLKETKYKITEIYSVEAGDLKCLLQNDEKIEITLITCENASTTRLIVKAEEV